MRYEARFSNGQIIKRQSARDYSHAWQTRFVNTGFDPATDGTVTGFAATEAHAIKAARAAGSYAHLVNVRTEVVPVTCR